MPLLIENAYRQTFAHRNDDFQSNMYDRGLARPISDVYSNCAVVFTYSGDSEISKLSFTMAKAGLRLIRVDSDFPERSGIDGIDKQGRIILGHEVLKPSVFWNRHFFVKRPVSTESQMLMEYYYSQMDSLKSICEEMSEYSVNGRLAAESLPGQLAIARASGFDIPETVITDNPRKALSMLGVEAGKVVVKALGSHWVRESEDRFIGDFPKMVDADVLKIARVGAVPSLFQKFVPHESEIRVYVIGDKIISYSLSGKETAAQIWEKPDSVDIRPCFLPDDILGKIKELQQNMKFDYGAIDLLKNKTTYSFLEINLSGDWSYFEKHGGDTRVSEAILSLFSERMT